MLAPGPRKHSSKRVTRTAYELVEAKQMERAPKPYVRRPEMTTSPWQEPNPHARRPNRDVRVVRVDPEALQAACQSADREQAIADLMGDRRSAESDRASFYQGWSVGPGVLVGAEHNWCR